MPHSLTHWAALMMVMLCSTTPTVRGDRQFVCLPDGIKPDLIVSTERVESNRRLIVRTVTVNQILIRLGARCKKGKLVDEHGREIYFYRLIGCWGNPPADYQELLAKQNSELSRLKRQYNVIEITCQTGDPRRISQILTADSSGSVSIRAPIL